MRVFWGSQGRAGLGARQDKLQEVPLSLWIYYESKFFCVTALRPKIFENFKMQESGSSSHGVKSEAVTWVQPDVPCKELCQGRKKPLGTGRKKGRASAKPPWVGRPGPWCSRHPLPSAAQPKWLPLVFMAQQHWQRPAGEGHHSPFWGTLLSVPS